MSSMTLLSFCRRFNSRSPCLIADWYCAFFASGLVVSITPATCEKSKILSGHFHERQHPLYACFTDHGEQTG